MVIRDSLTNEGVLGSDQEQMVRVKDLKKHYPISKGLLRRSTSYVRAVDGVSFSIPKGQTLGLIGESGCGKTTTGKALLRITEPTDGQIVVDGQDVTELDGAELKRFRQQMQMVYQDPTSSLNPRRTVGNIISEPMKIHDIGTKDGRIERVSELLDLVGLPAEDFMDRYPTSLSGGQKQRVGIARAICLNPKFVVLDEPTSALDVSVQARIIDLLEEIQKEFDLTYLFISHDLSLVNNFASWIAIMYLGKIVEIGHATDIFQNPSHPYTRALLSEIPTMTESDDRLKPPEIILEGELPDPTEEITGCSFRTRCPEAFDKCKTQEPTLYRVGEDHYTRCLLHDDDVADTPSWV
ncbi:ABC transporter ATP-binding protein [Natrialbaceae archaeon A-CW2]